MASDPNAPRSRRALLTAAAGGAAAMAASAAMPLTAAAATRNDDRQGDGNSAGAETSLTRDCVRAPQIAFKASTINTDRAALVGSTGDETNSNDRFTPIRASTAGLRRTRPDLLRAPASGATATTSGTYGSGVVGVWGDGLSSAWSAAGEAGAAPASGLRRHLTGQRRRAPSAREGPVQPCRVATRSAPAGRASRSTRAGVTSTAGSLPSCIRTARAATFARSFRRPALSRSISTRR